MRFTDVPGTEKHFTIPASAVLDPFRIEKALTIKFFVHDPLTLDPFFCYPRDVAGKAEEYLASTGIADTCDFDAKTKFYLFDSVRFSTDTNTGFYEVDSNEEWRNRGRATNLDGTPNTGYKTRIKGRSFPTSQSP